LPRRPPKKWFERAVRSIKRKAPEVTDPKALAAWVWHYWMTPKRKKEVLKEEVKAHDPVLRRKKVLSYKDYPVKGLIRLLFLEDGSIFPEYALYGAAKAGLKEDHIVRTNDYNLFVYREG
jgi:hypothetical protein